MCDIGTLAAFLAASAAIILAPGPAQALVLARTVEAGPRAGLLTAVGLNTATLLHAAVAGLGLSALLAASVVAFTVVKLAGAAYLVWLGITTLLKHERAGEDAAPPASGRRAFVQAFTTGVLNPKVAVFFLAFLPQFVCPANGPALPQFLVLGALLGAMDVLYECVLVAVAASAAAWLSSPSVVAWRSRVTGGVLIALGAQLALSRGR
jgi:threonine/homoserine/homoserine lactone efflux protein